MALPLVSIIIPVYQAEKYLKRCLNSVVEQSLREIEIILIDDGSTDNSGKICEEYATKDNRIKVIHQSNQGVSAARQTGLNNSTSDYIIHVDADDWIEPTAIEELYKTAAKTNADMVIFDYWIDNGKDSCLKKQDPINLSAHNVLLKMINQKLYGSCWNKIIKREYILKHDVHFPSSQITYCEDLLFNCRLLCHDIIITYLPKAFYHYYWSNQENLSNSLSTKRLQSRIIVNEELEKMLDENEKDALFFQKKDVLLEAFLLKQFRLLKNLYPEIQHQIIQETRVFNIFKPISSCLSMALKGHPYIAYYLYKTLTFLIRLRQSITPPKK